MRTSSYSATKSDDEWVQTASSPVMWMEDCRPISASAFLMPALAVDCADSGSLFGTEWKLNVKI